MVKKHTRCRCKAGFVTQASTLFHPRYGADVPSKYRVTMDTYSDESGLEVDNVGGAAVTPFVLQPQQCSHGAENWVHPFGHDGPCAALENWFSMFADGAGVADM